MDILRALAKFYFNIAKLAGELPSIPNAIVTGLFHGVVSYGLTKVFGPIVAPVFYTIREVEQLGRDFAQKRMDVVPWYDRVGDVIGAYLGTIVGMLF